MRQVWAQPTELSGEVEQQVKIRTLKNQRVRHPPGGGVMDETDCSR